jgi:hypothetical protein
MNTATAPNNPWSVTRAAKSHLPGRRALWMVLDELASKVTHGTDSFLAFRGSLASSCGISCRTLDRAKQELRALGFLSWEQTSTKQRGPRRGPNLYRLHLGQIWAWVLEQRNLKRTAADNAPRQIAEEPVETVSAKEPTRPSQRPEHKLISAEAPARRERSKSEHEKITAGFAAALAILRGEPAPSVTPESTPRATVEAKEELAIPSRPPPDPAPAPRHSTKRNLDQPKASPLSAIVDAVLSRRANQLAMREATLERSETRSRDRREQDELRARYGPKPKRGGDER